MYILIFEKILTQWRLGNALGSYAATNNPSAESASHTARFANVVCAFPIAFGQSICTASPTLKSLVAT
jgi:hypothetical protein